MSNPATTRNPQSTNLELQPASEVIEVVGVPDSVTIQESRSPIYAKIEGKWLKEGILSKNNNYYSPETVRESVYRTQHRITSGSEVTILETHDDTGSDRASSVLGRVTKVWMDGIIARYSGDIANTSRGRDVVTLSQGRFGGFGVSLRADPKTVITERAMHEGKAVRKVHPFEVGSIDFTRNPGLGEYGSVDSVVLMESVREEEVVPLEEKTKSKPDVDVDDTPKDDKLKLKPNATPSELTSDDKPTGERPRLLNDKSTDDVPVIPKHLKNVKPGEGTGHDAKKGDQDGPDSEADGDANPEARSKAEAKSKAFASASAAAANTGDIGEDGDEDEDDKKKVKHGHGRIYEALVIADQADFDVVLAENHITPLSTAQLVAAVSDADELGLIVPKSLREKLTLDVGADHFATFWYDMANALVEAKLIPFRGLEDYFRDHFPIFERKYSDGAGYTPRDRAAFPLEDYAGRHAVVPIRTQEHVLAALALTPYFSDQEGIKEAITKIALRKGLQLQDVPTGTGGVLDMTPEELTALIDKKVEERLAELQPETDAPYTAPVEEATATPETQPEEVIEESAHRDHLMAAHNHVATCLGYKCGDPKVRLGEASPGFDESQYTQLAEAHDAVASTLGMACAPKDAHPGAQRLPADRNPLQDHVAPTKQAGDAFGGAKHSVQSAASGKDMGSSIGESALTRKDLSGLLAEAVERSMGNNSTVNALIEAVKALTHVTTQNRDNLQEMKTNLEESEKAGWRDRPGRQTVVNESTSAGDEAELESLITMVNNKDLDPRTKLHNISSALQGALGITDE